MVPKGQMTVVPFEIGMVPTDVVVPTGVVGMLVLAEGIEVVSYCVLNLCYICISIIGGQVII